MAKQTINIGTSANDGTGSTLRAAFDITNDNFTELYDGTGGLLHKIEGTNFTGSLLVGHSTTGTLSSALGNTGIGIAALDGLTSGDYNVAVGNEAGANITTGSQNILIGRQAGLSLTTGSNNVAVGHGSLKTEDTHGKNVAIGYETLKNQDAGADAYNVAMGYQAGVAMTTGINNTLIGGSSGDALTTGSYNVALGYEALSTEDTGTRSIAIGYYALRNQNYDGEALNISIGHLAGLNISTGIQNTLIGGLAGDALTTGSNNIIIGYNAAASAVDVSNEVTIGNSSVANVRIPADSTLKIGASGDLQLEHLSSNSFIKNTAVGDLYIENQVDDGDVIFRSDDGSGGLATYFRLDGGNVRNVASKDILFNTGVSAYFHSVSTGLRTVHDGSNAFLINSTGNLTIQNDADDSDIVFKSDNGSGGTTEYFRVDGAFTKTIFSRDIWAFDNVKALFGTSSDLQIYHDGSNSYIQDTGTGNLLITSDGASVKINKVSNENMAEFIVDGAVNLYYDSARKFETISTGISVTGSIGIGTTSPNRLLEANSNASDVPQIRAAYNATNYLDIKHDLINAVSSGGNDSIQLQTAGTTGLTIDSSQNATFAGNVNLGDSSYLYIGASNDLQLIHDGTDSYVQNTQNEGDLIIQNGGNDKDVIFKCDDGSGGVTEYFKLDGSSKRLDIADSIPLCFGAGDDLQIQHNGSTSYIQNYTGDFRIEQQLNDGDMEFYCDDTSGGITKYFHLDGGIGETVFSRNTQHLDSVYAQFGNGDDLQILHDSNHSYIKNYTGDLYIENFADDKDIIFKSDDGSGGTAQYFRLDGGLVETSFLKTTHHYDNVKAEFGDGGDLEIYHNGSHSYIDDTGTGKLILRGNTDVEIHKYTGEYMITATADGAVSLYHNDVKRLETTSVGVNVTGNLLNSGYIYVNTGGAEPGASQVGVRITGTQGQAFWNSANSGTTGYNHFNFYNANGAVGSIVTNGSATAFNTSSDYRLKEDLKDFDGLDKVSKIPVYDFKWKVDDSRSYGVMAHELQEVLPDAVSGEKDAEEMQGVDYSKIVPLLIKSIQELEARVKTLENK